MYYFYGIYLFAIYVVTENLNLSTDKLVQPATAPTPTPITEQGSHIKATSVAVYVAEVILS